ncbi:MAG: glucosaminidase domain-containing protein [Gammaproteobacteria bacterium]|nr:glucosaminidase domain-containing protein [Gammaproteobacteria bacterium]
MSNLQKIIAASSIVVALFVIWILFLNTSSLAKVQDNEVQNTPIKIDNVAELQQYFADNNYSWPPENASDIPSQLIQSFPADLRSINDFRIRKRYFIQSMLPIIYAEQQHIERVRQTIVEKLNRTGNNASDHQWFNKLLNDYGVKAQGFKAQRKELLKRLDSLPTRLILAQAAIESAWGTSRFAREGNSLFGEWTYNKNNGLVPSKRDSDKTHRIKTFNSLRDSVRSYIKNINKNRAYAELREKRHEMRQLNKPLDAFELAQGLKRYSQKGKHYVAILHKLMRSEEFKIVAQLENT